MSEVSTKLMCNREATEASSSSKWSGFYINAFPAGEPWQRAQDHARALPRLTHWKPMGK
jgi:hypothetical protein